jgi:hypothetical protein
MKTSEQTGKIAAALSNFQGELKGVVKDSTGRNSNYASLAAILEMAQPLLKIHRLAVIQAPENQGLDKVCITTRVEHESGEYYESELNMPLPSITTKEGKEVMNACQKIGSAITFGRRYAYAAILGIAQVDDDAESMEEKAPARQPKQWEPRQQQSAAPKTAQTQLVDEEIGPDLSMQLLGLFREAKWELEDIKTYFREKLGAENVPDNFTCLKKSVYNKMASAAHTRIAANKKAEKKEAK